MIIIKLKSIKASFHSEIQEDTIVKSKLHNTDSLRNILKEKIEDLKSYRDSNLKIPVEGFLSFNKTQYIITQSNFENSMTDLIAYLTDFLNDRCYAFFPTHEIYGASKNNQNLIKSCTTIPSLIKFMNMSEFSNFKIYTSELGFCKSFTEVNNAKIKMIQYKNSEFNILIKNPTEDALKLIISNHLKNFNYGVASESIKPNRKSDRLVPRKPASK